MYIHIMYIILDEKSAGIMIVLRSPRRTKHVYNWKQRSIASKLEKSLVNIHVYYVPA